MKISNFEKTSYHVSFEGDITHDEICVITEAVDYFRMVNLTAEWSGPVSDMKCVISGFTGAGFRREFIERVNENIGKLS